MPLEVVQEGILGHARLLRRRGVGLGDDRHVALERTDDRDVRVVVGLRFGLGRLDRLGGLGERVGAALHLEVHPDLEQLERRQLTDGLGTGELGEGGERALEPERGAGLGRDREPDVELVVAQVVVADAGMLVDDVRGAPRVLRVDLGGDEHRGVAERTRIEDRRDLADDPLVEELLDAGDHLVLGDVRLGRDVLERFRCDWEAALHEVEQALVEVVERDRGAVLAAAELRAVLA